MQRISDKRMKEFESLNWPDGWGPEILQALKAERKYADIGIGMLRARAKQIAELKAQIKAARKIASYPPVDKAILKALEKGDGT